MPLRNNEVDKQGHSMNEGTPKDRSKENEPDETTKMLNEWEEAFNELGEIGFDPEPWIRHPEEWSSWKPSATTPAEPNTPSDDEHDHRNS